MNTVYILFIYILLFFRYSIQPSDTWCVETVNLTKEYKTVSGKHKAVDNLQLKVPFGQVSFFLLSMSKYHEINVNVSYKTHVNLMFLVPWFNWCEWSWKIYNFQNANNRNSTYVW